MICLWNFFDSLKDSSSNYAAHDIVADVSVILISILGEVKMNLTLKRFEKFVQTSVFNGEKISPLTFISLNRKWFEGNVSFESIIKDIEAGKTYPHQGLTKILNMINSYVPEKKTKKEEKPQNKYNGIVVTVYAGYIPVIEEEFKNAADAKKYANVMEAKGKSVKIVDYRFSNPIELKWKLLLLME